MSLRAFFAPEVVETFKSKFNTKIQIVNFSGQLRLDMGDLTQSGLVIEKIWAKSFKKLLAGSFFPKKILILGFGAGSVAKVISKKWPESKITGVEIDLMVIKIAKKYFEIDKIRNLTIINQRAEDYIKNTQDIFDLILIDCYQGYMIPLAFEDTNFLKVVKSKGKTVLLNRLFWDSHQQKTLRFLNKLDKSFTTTTCRTPSNLVISIS
jgi:spermidine synthase